MAPGDEAAAPDRRPHLSREALLVGHGPEMPKLSPDGQRLAYLAPWRGVMNVWVRTLGQRDDRVLTADEERDIEWFGWQCDSQHLLHRQDPGATSLAPPSDGRGVRAEART